MKQDTKVKLSKDTFSFGISEYLMKSDIKFGTDLTLKDAGGGQSVPMGFRLAAISRRIKLWSQKFLTLSLNILSRR